MDSVPEHVEVPSLSEPALETSTQTPEPLPSTLRWIFHGPFGLRAGWSLLIYLGIIFLLGSAVNTAQKLVKQYQKEAAAHSASGSTAPAAPAKAAAGQPQPIAAVIIGESVIFVVFLLLSWLMSAIERRKLAVYGFGGRHFLVRFLFGALWGLLAMSLLVAVLHTLHVLSFDARLDFGAKILGWGALLALAFLLVGLVEEYIFRGYLQFTLTRAFVWLGEIISPRHARAIAFWIASFFTSALFLFAHTNNAGEDKMGLISVFLAGVIFVVALWRTGSLWWAIGFHMSWDWAQSFLYGVPDSGGLLQGRLFATHASGNPLLSGGTVGPEGSVLVVPTVLLVIVVLLFTKPSPQPPLEPVPHNAPAGTAGTRLFT